MNQIQNEIELSKTKMLSTFEYNGKEMVTLSMDNVAIVEAMILNDSDYLKTSDKYAAPIEGKYEGSTAFWMSRLKSVLIDEDKETEKQCSYRDILKGAIDAVDRENSTHLNSDGVGRDEIKARLIAIGRDNLIDYLKRPDETKLKLIEILSQETDPKGKKSSKGMPYRGRKNTSFASKFCHYACFYLFEGENEQDNYSIYDNVLCKAIPLYESYYKIDSHDLKKYNEYRKAVDEIIAKSESGISRNGFDHLLWYYYKGRI